LVYPLTKKKYLILENISRLTNGKENVEIQTLFNALPDTANEVVRTYVSQMSKMGLIKNTDRGEYKLTKLGALALRKTRLVVEEKKKTEQEKIVTENPNIPKRTASREIPIVTARNIIHKQGPGLRISYEAGIQLSSILDEVGMRIVKDGLKDGEISPKEIVRLSKKILKIFEG